MIRIAHHFLDKTTCFWQ